MIMFIASRLFSHSQLSRLHYALYVREVEGAKALPIRSLIFSSLCLHALASSKTTVVLPVVVAEIARRARAS
jgi:hypothetical protein